MPDRRLQALVLVALLAAARPAAAREETTLVQEEAKNLFREVPDLQLALPGGKRARLSELWTDKPLLVTLFYERCEGACSPFLRSLKTAIDRVGGLGDDYRVVSVSIDPDDEPARVGELAKTLEIDAPDAWFMGVGSAEEVDAVARAVGFWYRPIPGTDQFDHPSLVAAVRDGRIVRVLLGNTVSVPRFRELVMELKGVYVPVYTNPDANTLFRCFEVDETTGRFRLGWGLLVLLVPAMAAVGLALLLFSRSRARPHPIEPARSCRSS